MKKIITEKKGTFLEGTYVTQESKLKIKCDQGHEFTIKCLNLKKGNWCQTCGLQVLDETKAKISTNLKKFLTTEEGKKNKAESLQKRSKTMEKLREEARKDLTHIVCAKCQVNKPVTDYCKKAAAKNGYQSWCKPRTNDKKMAFRKKQKEAKSTS